MVFTPDPPFPKAQGHPILSKDWNAAINEVVRLEGAKVNRAGDTVTGSLTVSGNLGVGTNNPGTKLHVAGGGSIRWGNNSELVADQGGSIELGGNNTTPGTGSPYIDFHFSGPAQDFNTRIINDASGRLSLIAPTLRTTGNVGIGTAGPDRPLTIQGTELISLKNAAGATKWHINDLGGTGDLNIAESGVADARLYIRAGGNVGIGTTTPRTALEVRGHLTFETGGSPILFTGTGTSELNRHLSLINSPDSTSASGLKAGGVLVSDTYAYANPSKNDLIVKGNVGIGTAAPQFGRLMIEDGAVPLSLRETGQAVTQGGLWRMPLDGGILRFDANTAAAGDFSTYVTPLAMNVAGNVGIGTSTPAAKLQVSGGAIMPAIGNSRSAGIQFPLDPGGGGGDEAFIRYFAETGETTKLLIGCQNDADDRISFYQAGGERLTIYNGNVGFGTLTPVNRLDVNGDVALMGKHALRGNDPWLRLNQDGAFTAGVHTPGVFAPLSLNVGGAGGWGNPGGGNAWFTGSLGIGTTALQAKVHVLSGEPHLRLDSPSGRTVVQMGKSGGLQWDFGVSTDGTNNNFWFGDFQGYRLVLEKGTGHVGIGTTDPTAPLHVNGDAVKTTGAFWGGVSSDKRLKKRIKPLKDALDRLSRLRGVNFEWRKPEEQGNVTGTQMGLVAQEVEEVLPEWVGTDRNGYKTLTIQGFDALVIESLKELKAENERLDERIKVLEVNAAGRADDRGAEDTGEVVATEAAERKARELGVQLSEVEGTGSGGRVVVRDVERAAKG